MANLPLNTTYNNLVSAAASTKPKNTVQDFFTKFRPERFNQLTQQAQEPAPQPQPQAQPTANFQIPRFSPIPEGTQFIPPNQAFGATSQVLPSEQAKYVNFPQNLGGGQFTVDPLQKGRLIKSSRGDIDPKVKAYMRSGLSSDFFQVDHIVPLWAGGADTDTNLQTLSIRDHAKKSKIEGVARSLYYSGELGLNEARVFAMNWHDLSDDKVEVDDNGNVDLGLARRKVEEWRQGPKVGLKEWWQSFKEGPRGVTGEFAQGVASGATFGWVPVGLNEYEDPEELKKVQVARVAGQVVGGVMGFIAGTGLLGAIAKTTGIARVFQASSLGRSIYGVAQEGGQIGRILGTTASQGKFASMVSQAARRAPQLEQLLNDGKLVVGTGKVAKALETSASFAILGQVSRDAFEKDFGERVGSFFKDAALGSVIGSAGYTWKGFSQVGAGTLALSLLDGASPAEAWMNTGVMVGFHAMGFPQAKKMETAIDNAVMRSSFETRYKWLNKEVPKRLKTTVTQKQLELENAQIMRNIGDALNTGTISESEAAVEAMKVVVGGRQIYKGGLTQEARLREEVADLLSYGKKSTSENKMTSDVRVGPSLYNYLSANRDIAVKMSDRPEIDIPATTSTKFPQSSKNPEIQITGTANRTDPITARNIVRVSQGIKEGRAEPEVFLQLREDLQWQIKVRNDAMDKAKIDKGEEKLYEHPANNIQAWARVDGEYVPVGFIPREFRIEQSPLSQNNRIRRWNQENPDKAPLPELDPTLNKDSLAQSMRDNNIQVLRVGGEDNVKFVERARESGEPSVIIRPSMRDWQEAVIRNKGIPTAAEVRAQNVRNSIRAAQETTGATAADYIKGMTLPEYNAATAISFRVNNDTIKMLGKIDKILESRNPETLMKEINGKMGRVFTKKEATALMKKENPVFRDVLSVITNAAKKGRLSGQGKAFFINLHNELRTNPTWWVQWPALSEMPLKSSGSTLKRPSGEIKQDIEPKTPQITAPEGPKTPVEAPVSPQAVNIAQSAKNAAQAARSAFTEGTQAPAPTPVTEAINNRNVISPDSQERLKNFQKFSTLKTEGKQEEFNRIREMVRNELDDLSPIRYESNRNMKTRMRNIIRDRVDAEVNRLNRTQRDWQRRLNNTEKEQLMDNLKSYMDVVLQKYPETNRPEYAGFEQDFNELPRPQMATNKREVYPNTIGSQIKESAARSGGILKTFWEQVSDGLEKRFSRALKQGGFKEPEIDAVTAIVRDAPMSMLSRDEMAGGKVLGVDPVVLKLSNLVRLERFKELPEALQARISEIKKSSPNKRISAWPTTGQAAGGNSYNMFGEIRSYVKRNSFVEKLRELGIKNITPEETKQVQAYLRGQITADELPERISSKLVEEFQMSKSLDESQMKSLGVTSDEFQQYLGNIKTERDFDEIEGFNVIRWLLAPFEDAKLTESMSPKEAQRLADDFIFTIAREMAASAKNVPAMQRNAKTREMIRGLVQGSSKSSAR